MKKLNVAILFAFLSLASCSNDSNSTPEESIESNENESSFAEVGSVKIGGEAAAEITTYDEITKKLFTVNNSGVNQIDIVDLSDPANPKITGSISLSTYNAAANSVSVYNQKLAVAAESTINKQNPGKVLVFNTSNLNLIKEIEVGSLPDMVTFSPDGKYILTANEGEPNNDYSQDPDGTVSIIDVNNNYSVVTLNFASFSSQAAALKAKGFRVSAVANSFAADIEPEYITVSDDSKTAWVTLQENNGVAKIDLTTKTITTIFPLGLKDYNSAENAMDLSDKDDKIVFAAWKVKGLFMPDAISNFSNNNTPYFVTVNEGDAREYTANTDIKRMKNFTLDPTAFPNAAELKSDAKLGRLNLIADLGDKDGDGDLDEMVSFGARSFSIWNGTTGALVYDSKNELDKKANELGTYDDGRSDDKGSEPEAVTIGKMGNKNILFVGAERSDVMFTYDISNPSSPTLLQTLKTGDAPEGILFIPASKSPNKKSIVVVSSEGDGTIKIYQPNLK